MTDRDKKGWTMDPRSSSNTKMPDETPSTVRPKSATQAARYRKKDMKACLCRLCAIALLPPASFAEWTAYGLDAIRAEHEATVPRTEPWKSRKGQY